MRTRVGYCGGTTSAPTYHNIGDHAEAVQVDFDPNVISYASLVQRFWAAHEPTRKPWSTQYMAAAFFDDPVQEEQIRRLIPALSGDRLETLIVPVGTFTRAEDYHQKYRLRHDPIALKTALLRYNSDREFVDSTLAARINGYLSGWGKKRELERILPRLGLAPAIELHLLARVNG